MATSRIITLRETCNFFQNIAEYYKGGFDSAHTRKVTNSFSNLIARNILCRLFLNEIARSLIREQRCSGAKTRLARGKAQSKLRPVAAGNVTLYLHC